MQNAAIWVEIEVVASKSELKLLHSSLINVSCTVSSAHILALCDVTAAFVLTYEHDVRCRTRRSAVLEIWLSASTFEQL